jgi:putative membrane protein
LHIIYMVLEMLLWNKPVGHSIFGLTPDIADRTGTLAANQGLYNGFVAAGLIWSLLARQYAFNLQVFFLGCVIIAGIFVGITAHWLILWIQRCPA